MAVPNWMAINRANAKESLAPRGASREAILRRSLTQRTRREVRLELRVCVWFMLEQGRQVW
jgi:hypothetical protein